MTEQKENRTVKTPGKKNIGNDKRRLLAVLEIMKRTDEEHPLTKNQIMDKVIERGVDVNNLKTIAADLAALKELDYDIVTDYSGSYMVGGQLFENYELKILADNIANARYLTTQHSQELIDRIKKLASESGEEMITATTIMDPKLKSSDGKMKYKLDILFRCIQKKNKVQFCYKKHALIYIKSNIKCNKKRICSIVSNRFVTGWGTVIRTQECRSQSLLDCFIYIIIYYHITTLKTALIQVFSP